MVTYIDSSMSEEKILYYVKEAMRVHGPELEIVLTVAFRGFVQMDNSLSVQDSLRKKGREDLIRPLEGQ
jgi:hypothetical protein